MSRIFTSASAAVLALFLSGQAYAADAYTRQSTKDAPEADAFAAPLITHWGGFYVTGALGVAKQDYDASRSVDREFGTYKVDTDGPDRKHGTTALDADNTKDPVRYETPLFNHSIGEAFSFDSGNNLEGGAELSYKIQRGRIIIEPFVSANLSGADDKGVSYDHANPWKYGDIFGSPTAGKDATAGMPGSGDLSVSKNWDANVGGKLGYLLFPNVNLYIGGGLTYGDFDIKGGDVFKSGQPISGRKYPYAINDSDGSFGYVALAGVQVKQDRFVFGVQGEYRDFGSISAGSTTTVDGPIKGTDTYSRTSGHDSIDVTEWAVKGTLSYQLSE